MSTAMQVSAAESGTFRLGGDLEIWRMGFGAMRITGPGTWGDPKDPQEAKAVLRRAVELGVNFIDTADSYGPEVSEDLIAQALHPYPKDLVIATKGGFTRQGPNQWAVVCRPEYLRQCVEMSLRRLKLDRIDLYQLHRIDEKVPVEESLGALKDLQQQGKIRHIGLSEVSVAQIEQAKKLVNIVSLQNSYSLTNRDWDDVLAYCEKHTLGFIPFFPLNAGRLTEPGGELDTIAKRKGATPAQISLAWLLKRSPVMLPIPGTSSVAHLEENVAASEIKLTDEEFAELDKAGRSAG